MTIEELVAALDCDTASPADEAALTAFERLVEHRLPDDYRAFLGRTGGGCSTHWGFAHVFGGLRCDTRYSLSHHVHDPSFGPLPRHLVWIGDASSGDPITLCLRDDRLGEVFLIDHELCAFEGEREPIEQAETYGLAIPQASSFTAFVGSLALAED